MHPCLLLVLALLGTASASHPAPRRPREVSAGMAEEAHKYRYSVVAKLRTYTKAQRYCQEVLRGQLASVHSTARNQELLELARTYVHGLLWIGAVTKCRGGRWVSQWEDSSPWNYANWAPTNPIHLVATCATLSTFDGLWRSKLCFQRRPFICQY